MSRVLIVLVCCAVTAACGGSPTGPSDPARTERLTRTRFMAFGDSLVTGDIASPQAAWPVQLQSQLRSRYASQAADIVVSNAGQGGERLVDGVLRFESAFAVHRPEVVLLMEGINDLGSAGPDISTTLLQFMAQHAMSRNARVFVASMLPTVPGRRRSQPVAELVAFNERIQQMCLQQGAVFVDLYNLLLPEAESVIGVDGLHPSDAGYRRIADVFLTVIARELAR